MIKVILGFDTSAYTTSCAVIDMNQNIISDSRTTLSVKPGERGLRQNEAVFQHLRNLPKVLEKALSCVPNHQIAAVCASEKPLDDATSYMPVFLVGKSFAQAIASSLNVPIYCTTHQRGHFSSAAIYHKDLLNSGFLAIHISGGTNQAVLYSLDGNIQLLSDTGDISAGQLLDRLGVEMGLSFPAGPAMDKLAASGIKRISNHDIYPVAVQKRKIHFSGVEAAARRDVSSGKDADIIAALIFDSIARGIIKMILNAFEITQVHRILITGGVASSDLLRNLILKKIEKRNYNLKIFFGEPKFSSDNAVGIACIGLQKYNDSRSE